MDALDVDALELAYTVEGLGGLWVKSSPWVDGYKAVEISAIAS